MIATVLLAVAAAGGVLGQGGLLDRALAEFWDSERPPSREKAAESVVRLGADFDTLYRRLEEGPRYTKDVETGLIEESRF